jgi:hypothetical protein
MMASASLQRSERYRARPKRFQDPDPQLPRIEKRRSPRLLKATQSIAIKTISQTKRTIRYVINQPEPRERASRFVEDSASEEADDEDEEDGEDEEETYSDKVSDFTTHSIEYNAADPLDRRDSHDSRLESGNEEYELDDFVVDDDSDDSVSDMGSEITVYGSDDESCYIESQVIAAGALVDEQRPSSTVVPESKTRKLSATSTQSSDSGLFVSDPNDVPQSLSLCPVALSPPAFQVMNDNIEPADIAEEISDAISRFSRRCNRHCVPLRLILSRECFEDAEISDTIARATKQGLGSCTEVGDRRVICVVGPRVR